MPTNNELEKQVASLREDIQSVRQSNSRMRDEIGEIRNNYTSLVSSLNERLEDVRKTLFPEKN